MRNVFKRLFSSQGKFSSGSYWEKRYAEGGNSGDGSYGRLAVFKAEFINQLISKYDINTVIEFGCGDGNQLLLMKYPKYLGLDISPSIIKYCAAKFSSDKSKSFFCYDSHAFFNNGFLQADLTISLDVIYHLVEENIYEVYVNSLFAASSKYVLVYSTNFNKVETDHVVHRNFVEYVRTRISDFEFLGEFLNRYPGSGEQESQANFYLFKRKEIL